MTEIRKTKVDKVIKILSLLIIIFSAILFSFIWQGERFTAQDWMILYQICEGKKFSDEDLLIIYWDKKTDFKNFLLNK